MIQTHNFPFGAVWKESLCKQALFSRLRSKKNPEGFFLPLIAVNFIENLLIPLILRLKLCKQVGPVLARVRRRLISRRHSCDIGMVSAQQHLRHRLGRASFPDGCTAGARAARPSGFPP